MNAVKNINIIKPNGIIWDATVTWNEERIVYAGASAGADLSECTEVTDGEGKYIAPGLIDIHCHGIKEKMWVEDPVYCAEHYVIHGETTVLPTFAYIDSFEKMMNGAKLIREYKDTLVGRIFRYGIYMEGPYMRLAGGNIDQLAWGDQIFPEEYIPLVDNLKDLVRVWAVDPDREGIEDFLKYVLKTNPDVIVALGHSVATADTCRRIRKYGVRLRTHYGDCGLPKGRAQGTPGAGGDEYTLNEKDMYAELIMDKKGIHVIPEIAKMLINVKGPERVCLITDGITEHKGNLNNEKEGIWYGEDLNYDNRGFLAGSCMTLEHACRNVMTHTGYGLCHSIRMASLTPAELLGIDDEIGSIETGKIANMILIDDKVNVHKVWLGGELVATEGNLLV